MDATTKLSQARHGKSLEQIRGRFKRWRETRVRGEHIPAVLWEAAVGLAVEQGVDYVARELHVDCDGLKKRMGRVGGAIQASKGGAQFVELAFAPPLQPASLCECVIELENVRGAKMRVELNGNGLAGLAGLCSAFWSAA